MADLAPRRRFIAMVTVGIVAAATGYSVKLWTERQPDDRPNPAAVQALMALSLQDLDGANKAIDNWRGKVLVVNFWATWCAPCRQEIPEFVKLQGELGARGLQFVGIAIDQPRQVGEFVRDFHINYPVLIAGLNALELMRESGNRSGVLPFTLIVDRSGKVVRSHRGRVTEAMLESTIKPLL